MVVFIGFLIGFVLGTIFMDYCWFCKEKGYKCISKNSLNEYSTYVRRFFRVIKSKI